MKVRDALNSMHGPIVLHEIQFLFLLKDEVDRRCPSIQ